MESKKYKVRKINKVDSPYGPFKLPRTMWLYYKEEDKNNRESMLRQIWNEFGDEIKDYDIYQFIKLYGIDSDGK